MKRTQLYLPEKTLEILKRQAGETNKTVSEIVRDTLDESLKKKRGSGVEFLLKITEQAKKYKLKGSHDLSENHDKYLYGGKSPKWAYLYKNEKKKK